MNIENLSKRTQKVVNQAADTVEKQGKKVVNRISNLTEQTASEVTEEAIITAVDKALDVMRVAGQRVRDREMKAENVALEVNVSIVNVVELKIKADVPRGDEVEDIDLEVNES